MQRALLDVGLGGVLAQRPQRVADLRHVDLAVTARVEQLERLLELYNGRSALERDGRSRPGATRAYLPRR